MSVTSSPWFRLSTGETAELFTLSRGGLTARVGSFGATLVGLDVPDREGVSRDIVVGYGVPREFESNAAYFGSTVGRYANRIAQGRFELDGRAVTLDANGAGGHHLHGGVAGFSHRLWEVASTEEGDRVSRVTFRLRSPDGDQGYPGTLDVSVSYELSAEGALATRFHAETDAPTHLSLTNHAYWNLAGSGEVLDHHLRLAASRYTPTDDTLIPTGELAPVTGTAMDFTAGKTIGAGIQGTRAGFDHNLVVDAWGGTLQDVAWLSDPASGRTLELATTLPGIQLYTPDFDGMEGGKGGAVYHGRGAVCLEPQFFPDSPNQPGFPDTRLDPGDVWEHAIVWRFTTD